MSVLSNSLTYFRKNVYPKKYGDQLSQHRLAMELGISPKTVAKYERKKEQDVKPAILLACSFVDRYGLEYCERIPDPDPEDIDKHVQAIPLPQQKIATLLGIRRQVLYCLRTGCNQKTVKRFFLLAVLELREGYGLSEARRIELSKRLDRGARYRDRRSSQRRVRS